MPKIKPAFSIARHDHSRIDTAVEIVMDAPPGEGLVYMDRQIGPNERTNARRA